MYLSEPSGTAVRAVHGAIWPLYFRLTISHFLAKNTGNMKRYALGAGLEGIYFSVVTTQQQIHKCWSLVSTDQGCQNPGLEGCNQTGFYLVPTRLGESCFRLAGLQHLGTGFQLRSCRSNRQMWYVDAIRTTPKTAPQVPPQVKAVWKW